MAEFIALFIVFGIYGLFKAWLDGDFSKKNSKSKKKKPSQNLNSSTEEMYEVPSVAFRMNDLIPYVDEAKEMQDGKATPNDIALEEIAVDSAEVLNEIFHENGKIKERFHIKNEKKEGLHQNYYENGQLMCEQTYKNGLVHGATSTWYEDGNKLNIIEIKKGKVNGLCQHWWPNGQLCMRGSKINERQHGLWENYYKNGQLQSKGNWNHGFEVYDGVGGIWYENGNITQETLLIDDKIIGKQYDINGKLEREIDFTSGQFIFDLMNEPDEQSIMELLKLILWKETEELGDKIESILDETGYVSPLPKSDDIIKLIEPSNPDLATSFKLALKFNKKESKKKNKK